MVAGDVEFVFVSRNERSFKQIEIKKNWSNYVEENVNISTLYCTVYSVINAKIY